MELAGVPRFTIDQDERFVPDFTEGVERGLYLAILEMLDEGLLIVSDETILEVNSAACHLLERRYGELAGRPLADLFASEQAFLAARARLFIQGQMRGSLQLAMPGGGQREMRFCAAARMRPGIHVLILSPDAPREGPPDEAVWTRLAAALEQPLLVLDAEDRVSAANAAALRQFGLPRHGLVGRSLSQCFAVSWPSREGETRVQLGLGSAGVSSARILPGPKPGWRLLLLAPPRLPASSSTASVATTTPVSGTDQRVTGGLPTELALALDHEAIALRFRPQWRGDGRALPAAVVELEWNHPRYGQFGAAELLAGAGVTTSRLGEWLMRGACAAARGWAASGMVARLCVPVALVQLAEPNFFRRVARHLDEFELEAERLELVIDSAILDRTQSALDGGLRQVAELGCRLAVGGVGRGNVDLHRLADLPIHRVYCDGAMAREGRGHLRLLEGTLGLAQTFGQEAVVSGVNSELLRAQMIDLGFSAMQGQAIGRPLAPPAFARRYLSAS
ncbi:MAG: EAL domain-containing protein [Zoogloeaceae bacterium]|nr:EAL domain-containing protein [Zoogloeaceae bacterium]